MSQLPFAAKRKMQIIRMKMDNIKLSAMLPHFFEHQDMVRKEIMASRSCSKGSRTPWNESCIGAGVAAGEERNVVPETHQFFGKPGNNALRAPIPGGRNAFVQWCNLGNFHRELAGFAKLLCSK